LRPLRLPRVQEQQQQRPQVQVVPLQQQQAMVAAAIFKNNFEKLNEENVPI
jgi:hypothetical protein